MPLARSALSILLLTGVGLGQAPDVEREALRRQLAEERARLREQEARLDALERQLEAGVRPAQAEDGGPDEAARPLRLGMFYVESADGAHRVELGGRLQVDGRFVLGRDPGDVDDGFQARRARVELRGHLWRRLARARRSRRPGSSVGGVERGASPGLRRADGRGCGPRQPHTTYSDLSPSLP